MHEEIISLITKIRNLLSTTTFISIVLLAYYFMFNYNIAAEIAAKDASKNTALGLAIPVLAAVIVFAYSHICKKNIVKSYKPVMVRPNEGGPKVPKKMNKSHRKEFHASLVKITGSIEGMLIVNTMTLAYWTVYILMNHITYDLFGNISYYVVMAYKYGGIVVLAVCTVLLIIATKYSIKLRKLSE